jgi:acetyl-CoA carboxylase biotin carboxyl carrier protein
MIDAGDLPRLVRQLETQNVTIFECDGPEGFRIRLRFEPRTGENPAPALALERVGEAPAPADARPPSVLRSPGMGFLCLRHPLSQELPLRDGELAGEGTVLAFLRAGEVLTPVCCDRNAVVVRLLATEGALVGYGEPLFELC